MGTKNKVSALCVNQETFNIESKPSFRNTSYLLCPIVKIEGFHCILGFGINWNRWISVFFKSIEIDEFRFFSNRLKSKKIFQIDLIYLTRIWKFFQMIFESIWNILFDLKYFIRFEIFYSIWNFFIRFEKNRNSSIYFKSIPSPKK